MGGPVVDITFGTTAAEVPLAVRVWDVTADGATQGLVTRGIYRVDGPPDTARTARFQIAAQGYRFAEGHRLKVEVTANDAPYHQASNIPATVTVDRIDLTLPLLGAAVAVFLRLGITAGSAFVLVGGVGAMVLYLIAASRVDPRLRPPPAFARPLGGLFSQRPR